jgi:hypothetical protein
VLGDCFRAFESEFFPVALRLHNSAGDNQKNRARYQRAGRAGSLKASPAKSCGARVRKVF